MLLHSAALPEVSGLESQNAAIYEVNYVAAVAEQSVHLLGTPSSPVNTARSHVSTAQSVEAEEASTRPQASAACRARSVDGDSAASVAADDVHSSLGPSQLATAHERAVTSHRQSVSPSPSTNGVPQPQRSLLSSAQLAAQALHQRRSSHVHGFRDADHAKPLVAHSTASRDVSGPTTAVNHTPASVYAQDGVPPLLANLQPHTSAAQGDVSQGGPRRGSEGAQPVHVAGLSDATLQFPYRVPSTQPAAHSSHAAVYLPLAPALGSQAPDRVPQRTPGTASITASARPPLPMDMALATLPSGYAALSSSQVTAPVVMDARTAAIVPATSTSMLLPTLGRLTDTSLMPAQQTGAQGSLLGQLDAGMLSVGGITVQDRDNSLPNGFLAGAASQGLEPDHLPSSPQLSVMEQTPRAFANAVHLADLATAVRSSTVRSAVAVIEQAHTEGRGDDPQAASGPIGQAQPAAAVPPDQQDTDALQRTMSVKATHHPFSSLPAAHPRRLNDSRADAEPLNDQASPKFQSSGPQRDGGSMHPAQGSRCAPDFLQTLGSLSVSTALARQHGRPLGRTGSAQPDGMRGTLLEAIPHDAATHPSKVRDRGQPCSPCGQAASVEAVMEPLNGDRETADTQSLCMHSEEAHGRNEPAGEGEGNSRGGLLASFAGAAQAAVEGAASMSGSDHRGQQAGAAEGQGDIMSVGDAPQVSAIGSMWGATGARPLQRDQPGRRIEGQTGSTRRGHESRAQASGNAVASVSAGDVAQGTAKLARSAAAATSRMSYQHHGAGSCDDEAASERVADGARIRARAATGEAVMPAPANSNSNGEALGMCEEGHGGPHAEGDFVSDGHPPSPALSHKRPCSSHVAGRAAPAEPSQPLPARQLPSVPRLWEAAMGPAASTEAIMDEATEGPAYAVEAVSVRLQQGMGQSFPGGPFALLPQIPPGPPPHPMFSRTSDAAGQHHLPSSAAAPFPALPPVEGSVLLQQPGLSMAVGLHGSQSAGSAAARHHSLTRPPIGHSRQAGTVVAGADVAGLASLFDIGSQGREGLLPQTGSIDPEVAVTSTGIDAADGAAARDERHVTIDATRTLSSSSNATKRKRNESAL